MSTETEGEEVGKQPDLNEMLEMSKKAAWSVSSFKPGNGVELLRDDNLETYWQSDGAQPHSVNVQFQRKVKLQLLAIYVNYKHDESYTPSKISVRVGNGFHDLRVIFSSLCIVKVKHISTCCKREIKTIELLEPVGWTYISLCSNESREPFVQTYMLQLAILSNHQNGRDTHIRQMKIYGPRPNLVPREDFQFSSLEFTMFSSIR